MVTSRAPKNSPDKADIPYQEVIENAEQNIMICDAKGTITYLNPSAEKTLQSIEQILPVSASEIVGQSFDIFHKDVSYQQGLLKDPQKNFPRQALLYVNDDVILDLHAAAIFDKSGDFQGLQAVWSIATEKVRTEKNAALKTSMVEGSPGNMMTCDLEGVITYLNPAAIKTLKTVEDQLPCKVEEMVGQPFDIFHKDPSFQQGLLKKANSSFPRQALLDYKGIILDLTATIITDQHGEATGIQANWEVVTDRIAQELEAALKTSMVEGSPGNMMTCDLEGVITYLNPAAIKTLKTVEDQLPCKVDDMVGQPFDIFHKDPSFQQGLLKKANSSFPRQALLDYKGIILDLTATIITDHHGEATGIQANWEVVTDRIAQEREAALKSSMVEGVPINLMTCDLQGVITYLNPAAIQTLESIEDQLPCKASQVVGQPFDIFHKDPSFQQGLLRNSGQNFPRKAKLDYKGIILDLTAVLIRDQNGEGIGLQASWSVITDQEKMSRGIGENASRVSSSSTQLSAQANEMSQNVQDILNDVGLASEKSGNMRLQMDEVMGATEEMNAAINEISKGASESARIASEAVDCSNETNEIMKGLEESSREISNVTKAISSVAQQTNLLALNATIEAARAGEAGKGFAVVASEVKELAKETRTATDDITKKVENIQSSTTKAFEAIMKVADIIGRINEISGTTASSVEAQSVTTAEMAKIISGLNSETSEISDLMERTQGSVDSLANGVKDNASASEALSRSAEELNGLIKTEE
jgi:methyl-accepting chemotaxis protein